MSIKKELVKFKKFKETYDFKYMELEKREDGLYYNGYLVMNDDFNLNERDDFINVGYKLKGSFSKTLSNLHPYEFKFKGNVALQISIFEYSLSSTTIGLRTSSAKQFKLHKNAAISNNNFFISYSNFIP